MFCDFLLFVITSRFRPVARCGQLGDNRPPRQSAPRNGRLEAPGLATTAGWLALSARPVHAASTRISKGAAILGVPRSCRYGTLSVGSGHAAHTANGTT